MEKYYIGLILLLMSFSSVSQSKSKTVTYVISCDTAKIMAWYDNCIGDIVQKTDNKTTIEYYNKICMQKATDIYCKDEKVILYRKGDEVINVVFCSEAKKKSDIKLCNTLN